MAFPANPLALSIPEPIFEAWLRDSGYLEILDSTTTLSSSPPPPPLSFPSSSKPPVPKTPSSAVADTISSTSTLLQTLASLVTINPFAKLTSEDFSGETPSWTLGFVGGVGSYSWPREPSQARMRVQENVRRYARNYALLSLVFFACCLYQMPIPLLGLISSLGPWELLRVCNDRWGLEESLPTLRTILLRLVQFATFVILYLSNLQIAVFCTIAISYTVIILHASLRKLAPSKHSLNQNLRRKSRQTEILLPSK